MSKMTGSAPMASVAACVLLLGGASAFTSHVGSSSATSRLSSRQHSCPAVGPHRVPSVLVPSARHATTTTSTDSSFQTDSELVQPLDIDTAAANALELFQRRLLEARIQLDTSALSSSSQQPQKQLQKQPKEKLPQSPSSNEDGGIDDHDKKRIVVSNILHFHPKSVESRTKAKIKANQQKIDRVVETHTPSKRVSAIRSGSSSSSKTKKTRKKEKVDKKSQKTPKVIESKSKARAEIKATFHQQLLEAQLREYSRAAQTRKERRVQEFQQRLLQSKLKYDQVLSSPATSDVDTAEPQATTRSTTDGNKLRVKTDIYLESVQEVAKNKENLGQTSQYLTGIKFASPGSKDIGSTGRYFKDMKADGTSASASSMEAAVKSVESESAEVAAPMGVAVPDVATTPELAPAEEQTISDAVTSPEEGQTIPGAATTPEVSTDQSTSSLVGKTILGKFVIDYEMPGVSDKCDLYVAYHTTDKVKAKPLIVKLVREAYRTEQIAIEYNIYQDLFDRLSTEEERRLFVQTFDWIDASPETGDKAGFVMESGIDNLRGYIQKNGAYTGDQLRIAMKNVIEIVSALHGQEVIWTELKAENFIIFADGRIKGVDLESVAAHSEPLRSYTAETYPPEFPPDMLYQDLPDIPLDFSYDLWGLGMTLYELAVGEPFFSLERTYDVEYIKARLKEPHGIVSELYTKLSGVHEGARNVILQCVTCDPRLRRKADHLLKDPYFVNV